MLYIIAYLLFAAGPLLALLPGRRIPSVLATMTTGCVLMGTEGVIAIGGPAAQPLIQLLTWPLNTRP